MPGGLWLPNAGDPILSATFIDQVSKQTVILCTTGTRPSSPRTGMVIFQTDNFRFAVYGTSAWCEVTPATATTTGAETTSSGTYGNLSGGATGPAVSLTTATILLLTLAFYFQNSGANNLNYMSAAISGATTTASADAHAVFGQGAGTGAPIWRTSAPARLTVTAGVNTATSQYKTNGGTLTSGNRVIVGEGIPA